VGAVAGGVEKVIRPTPTINRSTEFEPLRNAAHASRASVLLCSPDQRTETSATDASAPTIPKPCDFEIRSFSNTRARITVLAG
jgi:hypothetical protein